MALPKKLPPSGQEIVNTNDTMSQAFTIWLRDLIEEMHRACIPPKGIVPTLLTVADIAANFTDGKGNIGGPYQWWVICNGDNGTPDLEGNVLQHKSAGAGGAQGLAQGIDYDTYEVVYLMRLP